MRVKEDECVCIRETCLCVMISLVDTLLECVYVPLCRCVFVNVFSQTYCTSVMRCQSKSKGSGASMAVQGRCHPLSRLTTDLYYRQEGKNKDEHSQTSWKGMHVHANKSVSIHSLSQ